MVGKKEETKMEYCVYKLWHGQKIEQVLEYFLTLEEAQKYFNKIPKSREYEVHIGQFVSSL